MNKRIINLLKKNFFRIFLLFLSFILIIPSVSANSNLLAKDITITLKNVTVKDALQQIEKKSGLTFMYDAQQLDLKRIVSLDIKNQSIEIALTKLFKGTNIGFEVSNNQILLAPVDTLKNNSAKISTKPKQITGIIKDTTGELITGANIRVKGTTKGAVSDVDGRYSIEAKDNDILLFTFMGFLEQQIRVGNRDKIDVVMKEDDKTLDELLVVGYGIQKKTSATSAIVQIDAKELKTTTSTNLSATLVGRLPGLTVKQSGGAPGADGALMVVRGYGSLNDNNPLIVVDGIIREYFPNISNDDVETISVLKDATATAVYGVRGANGVIMITTKRGKMQKPTVSLNSSVLLSQNAAYPKFLNGPEYAYWYDKAQELDGVPTDQRRFSSYDMDRIINGDPLGIYGNTDWFDLLFKDVAPTYNNNISVNGGNDKIRYYASLGAYNQRGIIESTKYDRYNFRMNMDAKITDEFTVEMNAYGSSSLTRGPSLDAGQSGNLYDFGHIFSQALFMAPYLPATYEGVPVGYKPSGLGNQNPINSRDNSGIKKYTSTLFQGNVALKYKVPFIEGLEAKLNLAYERVHSMKKSTFTSSEVYEFNPTNKSYFLTTAGYSSKNTASLQQWYSDTEQQALQASLNYNRTFGQHTVGGLFLYEYVKNTGESMTAGRKDFPIRDIMDLNYGETMLPEFSKGGHSFFHRAGYVMRINYSYADKYLFEATARVDGTPNFAPDKRWGIFPAVSAGWRISEEDFFKENVSFIQQLKIRGSVGLTGNDNVGGRDSYRYLKTASLATGASAVIGDAYVRKLIMSGVPNPDITWEKTIAWNGGIEANMWKGLLNVELDAFYSHNKDILSGIDVLYPPSVGGYYLSTVNFGQMINRGFEMTLRHNNHIGDFYYSARGTLGWSRNKIIEMNEEASTPDRLRRVGRSTGLKVGFIYEGLFQTQDEIDHAAIYEGGRREDTKPGDARMRDLNGDGKITMDRDYSYIGRSNIPELTFALNLNAEYKGFDMNIFMQGAALCDVAMCGYYSDRGFQAHSFYTKPWAFDGNAPRYLVEGAWRPDNPNGKYERLSVKSRETGSWMSSMWIRNGNYLRIKNVQLGYTVPRTATQKIGIEKIRFFVSGSNLFTFDHLEGLDPEMPDVNQGYYPQQRIYEVGFNVEF